MESLEKYSNLYLHFFYALVMHSCYFMGSIILQYVELDPNQRKHLLQKKYLINWQYFIVCFVVVRCGGLIYVVLVSLHKIF